MATEECRGCRHSKSNGRHLDCRRYPPQVVRISGGPPESYWPTVEPFSRCGEFMGRCPGTDLPAKAPVSRPPSDAGVVIGSLSERTRP